MHKQRIYIDTSVIGGCFDEEFAEWSNKLFDEFIKGNKIAVVSDVVIEELIEADEKIRNILDKIPPDFLEIVYRNDESEELSKHYIQSKAISSKF